MIPKSLSMQGIYSYKNTVTIDFDNLVNANLFGIFGPVGCGKSSILEAISFVLYGEIERLNIKDNRNYNIMNLSSNTLFIEFVFYTGKENSEYRFVVKGKRNIRNFDKVEKYERSAYKKENDQWIPLQELSAEKIIGLSYENFRRTIIIPQGRFNEFLNLGNTDRTQMLKDIFHLEKFELSGRTKQLDMKNKEEQTRINGILSQIKDISEKTIIEKEAELEKLKEQVKSLSGQLSVKEKKLNELNLLKNKFIKYKENKNIFQELSVKEKGYLVREESLNKYETCINSFKDILSGKNERDNRIKNNELELAERLKRLEEIGKELNLNTPVFEKIEGKFKNKDKIRIKSQELTNIIKIIELESSIPVISNKYNEYLKKIKEKEKQINSLKEGKQKLMTKINDQKKIIPDTFLLSEIKLWFDQKKEKENIVKRIIENIKKEVNDRLLINLDFFKKTNEQKINFKEILNNLTEFKKKNKEQNILLKNQFNELQLSQKLYNFSHSLKDGEPCPLCGSKEHPAPLRNENVQDKIESIKVEIIEKENEFEQIEKLSMYMEKLLDTEDSLKKHLINFKWENYSLEDEEKINEDFNNFQNINKKLNILGSELTNLDINIEDFQNQKEKINEELLDNNNKLILLRAEKKGFMEGLKILNYEDYKNISIGELDKQVNEINLLLNEIDNKYNEIQGLIKKLEDEKAEIQGIIKKIEENISSDRKLLEKDIAEVNSRMKKYNFKNMGEVQDILNKYVDIEKEKKEILNFKKSLHAAEENLKNSENEIKDRKYNEDEFKKNEEEVILLKTDINNYNQKIGENLNSLKEMKSNLRKKNKYEKDLEKLKERADNISLLMKLFRGSGFVNYISSIYLNNLCSSANERFYKLTRQNLKLEVSEDNSLQIRDFLNNGRTRSVKTLSGGQTFQVSLSLALSLAENISFNIGASQNFFFIDEGFGSLDKESLQLVFNTLKTLRKENRIVGVISHLEDLKQEIDVYLEVENDPENGSKIKTNIE